MVCKSQIEAVIGRMVLAGLTPIQVLGTHSPHFQLDQDHRIALLFGRKEAGRWEVNVPASMVAFLRSGMRDKESLFDHLSLVLLCDEELCWLYETEWIRLFDLDWTKEQKIFVRRPQNCSFRVWSESGVLRRTVPLNRFRNFAPAA